MMITKILQSLKWGSDVWSLIIFISLGFMAGAMIADWLVVGP